MSSTASQTEIIHGLRQRLLSAQHTAVTRPVISSGLPQFDHLLPHQGIRPGCVVEVVSTVAGISGSAIAMHCALRILQQPGACVVVDSQHQFNAAAAAAAGIPLNRMMMVRAPLGSQRSQLAVRSDLLWSLEQSARCPGVCVVLCWLDRASSTVLRRLQLAVESSGVTVFLMRPVSCLRLTSWADVRLCCEPAAAISGSDISVRVVHSRHAAEHHGVVSLRIDHETSTVSEIS